MTSRIFRFSDTLKSARVSGPKANRKGSRKRAHMTKPMRGVLQKCGTRPGGHPRRGGTTRRGATQRRREQRRRSENASERWLTSSEPRHREVGNGMEEGTTREGRAASGGEKPLKGGCPWTIRHEIRPAETRREQSRGRQTRPVGVKPQGCTDGRASVDWQASKGPKLLNKTCPGDADGSFESGRAPRSTARKAQASRGEESGGHGPDA